MVSNFCFIFLDLSFQFVIVQVVFTFIAIAIAITIAILFMFLLNLLIFNIRNTTFYILIISHNLLVILFIRIVVENVNWILSKFQLTLLFVFLKLKRYFHHQNLKQLNSCFYQLFVIDLVLKNTINHICFFIILHILF